MALASAYNGSVTLAAEKGTLGLSLGCALSVGLGPEGYDAGAWWRWLFKNSASAVGDGFQSMHLNGGSQAQS